MIAFAVIFMCLFAFFLVGILWAQRGRAQGAARARRRGRYVVATGWGLIGVGVAAHGLYRGDDGEVLAGALVVGWNAIWLWHMGRTART